MIIINDKSTCVCGAYFQDNGYCTQGHPIRCKHEWVPTDSQGHWSQCIHCGASYGAYDNDPKCSERWCGYYNCFGCDMTPCSYDKENKIVACRFKSEGDES